MDGMGNPGWVLPGTRGGEILGLVSLGQDFYYQSLRLL